MLIKGMAVLCTLATTTGSAMEKIGTMNNDIITGTDNGDVIDGLAGNDSIYGRGGNDYLSGGDGDDALWGDSGNDVLYGGSGNDAVTGGGGADVLDGGDGDDRFNVETEQAGDHLGDRIDGGAGRDSVYSLNLSLVTEAITLSRGDGINLSLSDGTKISNVEDFTIVRFGAGDDVFNAGFLSEGYNLYSGGDGRDLLRVDFSGRGADGRAATSVAVQLGPAAGWNAREITGTFDDGTTSGADLGGFDQLEATGSAGNDTLIGGALGDILYGGSGDDVLVGEGGYDTYGFAFGWGEDRITDPDTTGRIAFHGVAENGLTFSNVGGNLVITDGTNRITFNNYYSSGYTYDFVYEAAPPPSETWSVAPQSVTVNEGDGTVTFTVTRSDPTAAQTVYVSTVQNQGFSNVGDYVGKLNEPVVFAAGQRTQAVSVAITDDTIAGEPDETFGLIVQQSETNPVTTFLASATFTIHDDDAAPPPSDLEIVRASAGVGGSNPSLSNDGRFVAFTGSGVGNQIFVRDLQTNVLFTASSDADGNIANGLSSNASMSGNGEFVSFTSRATNLVGDDTNGDADIFVKNLKSGSIVRATTDTNGFQVQFSSPPDDSSLSSTGRYTVFDAYGRLVADQDRLDGIYVKDTESQNVVIASTDASGNQTIFGSYLSPSMSDDGRFVAFVSNDNGLVANDTNGYDLFVKNLTTQSIVRANVDAEGNQANSGSSFGAVIAGNGRHVAFTSSATNLVPNDTSSRDDVFVKDLETGAIVRASTDANGNEGDGTSGNIDGVPRSSFSISNDGRFVAFDSSSDNLVPNDSGLVDVFVKDLKTGAISRVNTDADGNPANNLSTGASISGDGRYIAFQSSASNLVPGDSGVSVDVFVVANPLYDNDTAEPPPPQPITPAESLQAAIAAYGKEAPPAGFARTGQKWEDENTGLFAEMYKRDGDGDEDYILAFRGTNFTSVEDWTTNANVGWPQWEAAKELQRDGATEKGLLNELGAFLGTGKTLHITGHSLGGALAQFATYELVQKYYPGQSLTDVNVSLTTWNALGGKTGLQQNMPGFDANLLNGLQVKHYAHPDDIVARLGNGHVGGETFFINLPDPFTIDFLFAHSSDWLKSLVNMSSNQPYKGPFQYFALDFAQNEFAQIANGVVSLRATFDVSNETGNTALKDILVGATKVALFTGNIGSYRSVVLADASDLLNAIISNVTKVVLENYPENYKDTPEVFYNLIHSIVYTSAKYSIDFTEKLGSFLADSIVKAIGYYTSAIDSLGNVIDELAKEAADGLLWTAQKAVEAWKTGAEWTDNAIDWLGGLFSYVDEDFLTDNDAGGIYVTTPSVLDVTGGAGRDVLIGNEYDNVLAGGPKGDLYFLAGGADTVSGRKLGGADQFAAEVRLAAALASGSSQEGDHELDGDEIVDFSNSARILAVGDQFDTSSVRISTGSVILDVDTDQDGLSDFVMTLDGDFNGRLVTEQVDGGTAIRVVSILENGTMTGADGDDIIAGTRQDDIILGGSGNDQIVARQGDDFLNGGDGNDVLYGGPGVDTLEGGTGADIFAGKAAGLNGDVILDFTSEDILHFEGVRFTSQNLSVASGSAILTIDSDGDGTSDTTVTLEGNFSGTFKVMPSAADGEAFTTITFATNLAPVANDDSYDARNGIVLGSVNLLTNDSDPDSDPLEVAGFDYAGTGALDVLADGTFSYTPAAGFAGTDTFTYTIRDPFGAEDSATVSLSVPQPEPEALNVITGTNRINKLVGTGGNDLIWGLGGNDWLEGKDGDDILIGGKHTDGLTGGRGGDLFVIDALSLVPDTVFDFRPSEGDRLSLGPLIDSLGLRTEPDIDDLVGATRAGKSIVITLDTNGADARGGVRAVALLFRPETTDPQQILSAVDTDPPSFDHDNLWA